MELKKHIQTFCIQEHCTIIEAMKVINEADERACFMVDKDMRLIRVFTDGDIRRALLKGAQTSDPIRDIHSREPFVVKEGNSIDDARQYLSKRISVVPIVNQKNQVRGLVRVHDVEPFLNIKSREVMILGMGYVGLTLAVILADRGFLVHGFDVNEALIEKLKNKELPFYERGMDKYLRKLVGNGLRLTTSLNESRADVYIITVGTPIDKSTMRPRDEFIRKAAKTIGAILKNNDLVILRSTVPVGLTRTTVLPILEEESSLKAGEEFYLAYCPERTAEGRALKELRENPQIIGGIDSRSIELASRLFNENTHTVVDVGSLEAAEMCKLLDNTYRDTIFAYANQMAMLCEKEGLDLNELTSKVNLNYGRNVIPKPSPGVGGACLSKDPYILMHNFERHGLSTTFIQEGRRINESAPRWIYERSQKLLSSLEKDIAQARVFIIGFAFKGSPETSDLRESTTLWFLDELHIQGVSNIWGYDAIVDDNQIENLGVTSCSLEDGFKDADAVFIMNNHRSYADLKLFQLIDTMNKPALFYDGWNTFDPADIKNIPGITYAGVGVG